MRIILEIEVTLITKSGRTTQGTQRDLQAKEVENEFELVQSDQKRLTLIYLKQQERWGHSSREWLRLQGQDNRWDMSFSVWSACTQPVCPISFVYYFSRIYLVYYFLLVKL